MRAAAVRAAVSACQLTADSQIAVTAALPLILRYFLKNFLSIKFVIASYSEINVVAGFNARTSRVFEGTLTW